MLKRLYANNYRCLVNFEIEFGELTLLMGPNGGGKSTLFDLLYEIRRLLVDKESLGAKDKLRRVLFSPRNLTAWVDKTEQAFELDVLGQDGLFSYRLVISHNKEKKKQRIELERLLLDGRPLFEFNMGEVQLYHDDHQPGPIYPFDWTTSALATIAPRNDNRKLTAFKQWIEKMLVVSLQPKAITSETEEESDWLNRDGANFASWYSYISNDQDKIFKLRARLCDTITGFHALKFETAGKLKTLRVGFIGEDQDARTIYFDLDQLSDGQRVMIVLYSLLLGLHDLGHTIFIDEPENYVALPEIQPWLMELNNACGENIPQTVLISHHPELIDYLGRQCGKWIERDPLGPARVKKIPERIGEGLKLSEQIARGWEE